MKKEKDQSIALAPSLVILVTIKTIIRDLKTLNTVNFVGLLFFFLGRILPNLANYFLDPFFPFNCRDTIVINP